MDLAINKVLVAPRVTDGDVNPARFTVVHYELGSDMVVLCQQLMKSPRKPFVHRIGSPITFTHCAERHTLDWDAFGVERQNFSDANHVRYYRGLWLSQNFPRGEIKLIDAFLKRRQKLEDMVALKHRVVETFEQFPQRKVAFLNGEIPTKCLKSFAKTMGISYDFLWDTLSRYYAFGQCKTAHIPAYGNCGGNISLPEDANAAAIQFPTGRGRKRLANNSLKRTSTKIDSKIVNHFLFRDLPSIHYFSFEHLCKQYNARYATEVLGEDSFGNKIWDYIPERFLTTPQFKTLLKKACGSKAKFEKIKLGAKEFRNKLSIKKSTVMKHVIGPSHMYEIDATVLDVHLVSKFCSEEKLVIERPVLYTVVDVATTQIVGFHLSLFGANAEAVTLALFNAMSDKKSFCEQWGYDYQEGDWPCHHVCHSLVIDRGSEYLDEAMAAWIKAQLGLVSVQITEAYIGRAKGTVEGLFNKLNRMCIHGLPGALSKGRAKAKSDTSNHATYTIDDLHLILIHEIIAYNMDTTVKKKFTQEHLLNGLNPHPQELWNWGMDELMGGGITAEPSELMSALLPKRVGIVSDKGLMLKKEKITYMTPDKQFEDLRQEVVLSNYGTSYEVEVMVLPSWNQNIWFQMGSKPSDIVTFHVADSDALVKNLHFEEAMAILEELSVFESNARYYRKVNESLRAKRQQDMAMSNMQRLKSLIRPEGKSPVKDRKANTYADSFAQSKNNAAIVTNTFGGVNTTQLAN
jgi:hypothetical protein